MILVSGGNVVSTACGVLGAGSAAYSIGLASNWWNPIGWLSGALTVIDLACLAYWGYDKFGPNE